MAKVSFEEMHNPNTNAQNSTNYKVKFFSLKNGEDAIVRIMIDSERDFDVRTVHNVKMDGWQYGRKVNCLMENGDSRTCPLCTRGDKLEQKLYIRLIKYTVSADGKVDAVPMIWERSRYDKTFGTQPLANHIRDYGPLSDIICRISRSGEGLSTVYTPTFGLNIMPATRSIYRDDLYVKDTELFGDFDVLGVSILDKNFDELTQFIQTGSFPVKTYDNKDIQPRNSPQYEQAEQNLAMSRTTPVVESVPESVSTTPAYIQPEPHTATQPQNMPWGNNNATAFARPRRY